MERNAFFDNAKFILIFLVVFGHLIQPFKGDSHGINTLYMWIYTFHMPAFIFLAGFFAKGSGNKSYILNLAKKLLIPYLIFQVLYTGFYFMIGKSSLNFGIFHPQWALWFLFSLFSWHLLLALFKKLPSSVSLSIAVLIGIGVGYFTEIGHEFSLSRTFVFFPFFLAGFCMKEDQLEFLKRRSVKVVSILVMVSVALFMYEFPNFHSGWLLASKSYATLGLPVTGGIIRFVVYATAVTMSISVFTWIPSAETIYTKLGERTLYVYLLHGFIIQTFRELNLFHLNGFTDFVGLAIIAMSIVILLSSQPILGIGQPLIEGRMTRLKSYIHTVFHSTNSTS